MADDKPKEKNMDISLSEKTAEGVYSNMVLINHSSSEFVLDFIQIMPGLTKAGVRSRVILAPEHAKRLLFALGENMQKYESINGEVEIKDNKGSSKEIPLNFGPPGEA